MAQPQSIAEWPKLITNLGDRFYARRLLRRGSLLMLNSQNCWYISYYGNDKGKLMPRHKTGDKVVIGDDARLPMRICSRRCTIECENCLARFCLSPALSLDGAGDADVCDFEHVDGGGVSSGDEEGD